MLSQNSPQSIACQIPENIAHQILSQIFENLRADTKLREKNALEIISITDEIAKNLSKWTDDRQSIMNKHNDDLKELKVRKFGKLHDVDYSQRLSFF